VLDGLNEIKICEAYDFNGTRTTDFPSHVEDLAQMKPIYRTVPGWNTDITGIRKRADLPENALKYVETVAELVGYPVEIISVGPDRVQTILD